MDELTKLANDLDAESQNRLLEYAKSLRTVVKSLGSEPDEEEFTEHNYNLIFKRDGEQVIIHYYTDSHFLRSITIGKKVLVFCCGAVTSYYDGVGTWKHYDVNSSRLFQVITPDAKIDTDSEYPIHYRNTDPSRFGEYREYASAIAAHTKFDLSTIPIEFELIYNKYRNYYRSNQVE